MTSPQRNRPGGWQFSAGGLVLPDGLYVAVYALAFNGQAAVVNTKCNGGHHVRSQRT
jgi:hypothetical protein